MGCGQLPVGGCDLDLTHSGPCVVDGRLTKSQRAKMTASEAERTARTQLAMWREQNPDRKVPQPPPGATYMQPAKAWTGSARMVPSTVTNTTAITAQYIGDGQFVSTDLQGISITWNIDTAGQLVYDRFGNYGSSGTAMVLDEVTRRSQQSWEESQRIAGGYTLRPPHPALDWERCGDAREHRPHRGYDNQTNCPGRTRPVLTDRNEGSWRNRVQVARELQANPIPQEFVICVCGCACECDGAIHFTDEMCACFYLGCACVVDLPDEPAVA